MQTSGPNGVVALTVEDGVAELRIDNPPKNVFSLEVGEDLSTLVEEVPEAASAAVLTAAGDTFCAGLDLDVLMSGDTDAIESLLTSLRDTLQWLAHGDIPVTAAARGPAPGAGAVMLCAADMRVLGEDAELWWPEYEVGLRAFGRTVDLVAAFGPAKATELMLLGQDAALDAETAFTLGFANRVVAPDDVDAVAREMAGTIAATDQAHGTVREYVEVLQLAREELTGTSRIHAQRMREEGGMLGR